MRSPRKGFAVAFPVTSAVSIAGFLVAVASLAASAKAEITLQDRTGDTPLVLSQPEDYILKNIRISGLRDMAALTLSGQIRSVTIENSRFGEIWSGANNKAAALEAVGASVGSFKVTDTAFYDAENQLLSLRDGTFRTVTFMHCSFKTSEAFLKKIYAENPWRTTPPTTEFYNIDRLELFDNEFSNTTIVIHPSVKTVVLRGDVSKLLIESPNTQVIRVPANVDPARVAPPDRAVVATTMPNAIPVMALDAAEEVPPAVRHAAKQQAIAVEAAMGERVQAVRTVSLRLP
jgi:hypothetical protein